MIYYAYYIIHALCLICIGTSRPILFLFWSGWQTNLSSLTPRAQSTEGHSYTCALPRSSFASLAVAKALTKNIASVSHVWAVREPLDRRYSLGTRFEDSTDNCDTCIGTHRLNRSGISVTATKPGLLLSVVYCNVITTRHQIHPYIYAYTGPSHSMTSFGMPLSPSLVPRPRQPSGNETS